MSQITNITTENFKSHVIDASMEQTIILTFSSSRYPESISMRDSLAVLADELQFTLAEVNLDIPENGAFVQYLRIASLPDVRVIHKGETIDMIQGLTTEKSLREKLSKHFMSEGDLAKMRLEEMLEQKQFQNALNELSILISQNPEDFKLKLLQAKAWLGLGKTEQAQTVLDSIPAGEAVYDEAQNMKNLLTFFAEAAKTDEVSGEAALYREACRKATQNDNQAALDLFLQILQENKTWNEGAARDAMMTLFGVLGPKHPLTWAYRAKLNTIWFI